MMYALTLAGWRELAVRGYPGVRRSAVIDPATEGLRESEAQELARFLEERVAGVSRLGCASDRPVVQNDPDVIARELNEYSPTVPGRSMTAAASVLIVAYEVSKEANRVTQAEDWEFLRHCRNAAAHKGRFIFKNGEPRRAAAWAGLVITRELEGLPLFEDGSKTGLLQPGDPVRLLWELDERYPVSPSA